MPKEATTHRSVVEAQALLLLFSLFGAWTIWLVIARPSRVPVFLGAVLALLVTLLFRHRRLRHATLTADPPRRVAWVPVVCAIVGFTGYGYALTLVHSHYYQRRLTAFARFEDAQTRRFEVESKAYGRASDVKIRRLERITTEIGHKRTNPRESSELTRLIAFVLHFSSRPQRAGEILQHTRFAPHSAAQLEAAGLALVLNNLPTPPIPPRLGRPPSETELPPWFGRLGAFFTVATQLLAALVVVLVFSRWRAGASEALFRTVMPVAAVAVAFGLAGNLPSVSRQLQAICLGPVIAGLAGAIGGLIVASMDPHIWAGDGSQNG